MAKLPTIDTNIKSKRIPLKVLFLDPNNYRFIDHQDYKQIDIADIFDARVQLRTIEFITGKNNEQIKDLIDSFKKNGYLPVDQIQVEEIGTNQFKVVEGNRRIATLKYLEQQYKNNKDIGELDPEIFNKIPVVYYDKVDESHHYILMGLKHISGNKKWPPLNQAQLLHDLIKVYNMTEDDVCKAIGIGKLKLRKSLRALLTCPHS